MNENMKEDIVITNADAELFSKSLDEGKVILLAVELGELASQALAEGYSDHFKAHLKLKGPTSEGVCFCGKPATHLVYY